MELVGTNWVDFVELVLANFTFGQRSKLEETGKERAIAASCNVDRTLLDVEAKFASIIVDFKVANRSRRRCVMLLNLPIFRGLRDRDVGGAGGRVKNREFDRATENFRRTNDFASRSNLRRYFLSQHVA